MATLSQMMNPELQRQIQYIQTQLAGGSPQPQQPSPGFGGGGGPGMVQPRPNPGFGGGGQGMANPQMMQRMQQLAMQMQRGGAPMSQQQPMMQQTAQRPQAFDPRAYMAQQQQAQQQRWQQLMQQLQANPPGQGMTPQQWTTPRTWGNTNAGVVPTPTTGRQGPQGYDPADPRTWPGYTG